MRLAIAFLLLILPVAAEGRMVTFKSQCNRDVYIAIRHEATGGSDGLGDSGSWNIDVTQGWWRIPPSGQLQLNVGDDAYVLAISGGGIVSATQEDQHRIVKPFCYSRKSEFKHEIYTRGNSPNGKIDVIGDCARNGGYRAPFEALRSKVTGEYGIYVIYANMCANPQPIDGNAQANAPGNSQPNQQVNPPPPPPPPPRFSHWRSATRAFRLNTNDGRWDEFDLQSNALINRFDERARKLGLVYLYDPSRGMWVTLGANGAQFRASNMSNFAPLYEGGWVQ